MAINVKNIAASIIGISVALILLGALTPTLISGTNTFTSTISNTTGLDPLVPLANNLPLIVLLAFVIVIILGVINIFD